MSDEEIDAMDDAMQAALADYQSQEEYEAEQDALPPHKRDGYAERMADYADMRRKQLREENLS